MTAYLSSSPAVLLAIVDSAYCSILVHAAVVAAASERQLDRQSTWPVEFLSHLPSFLCRVSEAEGLDCKHLTVHLQA